MISENRNRNISYVYKAGIVLMAVLGILLQCGIGTAHFSFSSFRMFTTLSNCAVALYYILYLICVLHVNLSLKSRKILKYFKFLITMSILLTGLVAHFMLRGMFEHMGTMTKAGLMLLHYIVPIGTLLDWILFDEKGKTDWKMPLFSAVFPLIYVGVTLLTASCFPSGNRYPYPFLDVDTLGVQGVTKNVLLLSAVFLLAGYAVVFLDQKWKK